LRSVEGKEDELGVGRVKRECVEGKEDEIELGRVRRECVEGKEDELGLPSLNAASPGDGVRGASTA